MGDQEHAVDSLTLSGDEGRGVAAIRFGEVPHNLRSEDVRMRKLDPMNNWITSYRNGAGCVPGEVKHLSTRRKIN